MDDGQACGNEPMMWPVGRSAWMEANQMEADGWMELNSDRCEQGCHRS